MQPERSGLGRPPVGSAIVLFGGELQARSLERGHLCVSCTNWLCWVEVCDLGGESPDLGQHDLCSDAAFSVNPKRPGR